MLKPPVTFGNKKLPKTTMIINITSATDCPSRKLGLCQLDHCGIGSNKCYALKFEKFRQSTLTHRRKQQAWWDQPVGNMLVSFKLLRSRMRRKITAVRVGESGDFRDLSDVRKLAALAAGNRDLTWYLYTARKDLFTDVVLCTMPDNVVVNGSGWMADNGFYAVPKGEVRPLLHKGDGTSKVGWCVGDCKKCRMCLKATGIAVYAREH